MMSEFQPQSAEQNGAPKLHYHILGIGGTGMSAIAHLLLDQGQQVSGCDPQANALTAELAARGAQIMRGHDPAHLAGVDVVVVSSALRRDQPEIAHALDLGIPVLKRTDLWRTWSEAKPTLAVAGTHGKTTTTAMTTLILAHLGHDPAYIVPAGGPVAGLDRFARWGAGPFVIEADEYDRVFLGLVPEVAVITSVDWDHVDIFPSREDVEETFATFVRQVQRTVVGCGDDDGVLRVRAMTGEGAAHWQTYGFGADADWRITDVALEDGWTTFAMRTPPLHNVQRPVSLRGRLQVPGRHNLQNAAGAIAAAAQFDVRPEDALAILAEFKGAARRFELKGEAQGVTFVDDYAHNPAKVAAAIAAARMRYGDRRLLVYFQPHTFSRTRALLTPLAEAFDAADVVLVGDIYPSRERQEDFPEVTAALLASMIAGNKAETAGTIQTAADRLFALVQPGDVVLTLGAGDGNQVGDDVRRRLCGLEAAHDA